MLTDGLESASGAGVSSVMLSADQIGTAFPGSPSDMQRFELSAPLGNKQPGVYAYVAAQSDWVALNPGDSLVPYDLASSVVGKPTAGANVMQFTAVRSFVLTESFEGSSAVARIAGTVADATFQINRISAQDAVTALGTLTFASGSKVGVFTQSGAGNMDILTGETVEIVAPDPQNATLANIGYTLAGMLTV